MRIRAQDFNYITLRLASKNLPATLAAVEGLWKRTLPDRPFSYFFAGRAASTNSSIAVQRRLVRKNCSGTLPSWPKHFILPSMGLLGLASAQRPATYQARSGCAKCWAPRWAASSTSPVQDFLTGWCSSRFIASPRRVARSWPMRKMVAGTFAYRIDPALGGYLRAPAAGAMALLIAVLTVSFHAFRSAMANPAISLRTE